MGKMACDKWGNGRSETHGLIVAKDRARRQIREERVGDLARGAGHDDDLGSLQSHAGRRSACASRAGQARGDWESTHHFDRLRFFSSELLSQLTKRVANNQGLPLRRGRGAFMSSESTKRRRSSSKRCYGSLP